MVAASLGVIVVCFALVEVLWGGGTWRRRDVNFYLCATARLPHHYRLVVFGRAYLADTTAPFITYLI